ncbi:hypothetical protein GCM10007898_16580 [Dyella flagellata]|uniref:Uncharacterized protein n=1 Tax=Dyella flagellata TaxID=1867833 RepID=A0ABQ5XA12_9GAMM|nr:hypothetical protein GCM10007898_16580 [Dyella flagellata]
MPEMQRKAAQAHADDAGQIQYSFQKETGNSLLPRKVIALRDHADFKHLAQLKGRERRQPGGSAVSAERLP